MPLAVIPPAPRRPCAERPHAARRWAHGRARGTGFMPMAPAPAHVACGRLRGRHGYGPGDAATALVLVCFTQAVGVLQLLDLFWFLAIPCEGTSSHFRQPHGINFNCCPLQTVCHIAHNLRCITNDSLSSESTLVMHGYL